MLALLAGVVYAQLMNFVQKILVLILFRITMELVFALKGHKCLREFATIVISITVNLVMKTVFVLNVLIHSLLVKMELLVCAQKDFLNRMGMSVFAQLVNLTIVKQTILVLYAQNQFNTAPNVILQKFVMSAKSHLF